ncbi:xanthine dehydrogenase family protein molybdopterin-binding subunit [Paraburkholderia hospita]|uniref:xanthine dehydrogenase family protein molybdopterin-binding subunit n=1 Tax=Paraburkholderia hospita TaxID=169430 RepID=UPI000271939E|nr:molybdopterin cofactor-binding domain-containing protein [Paraburkholderia hospita]EUC12684.1 Isoquinoline 1-oxidoreductase [Burkholderia sp. BT03]SKC47531.1 CO or xanthine dehydrogenase, Mo-binding subunit [Paraburkholderia hospita]
MTKSLLVSRRAVIKGIGGLLVGGALPLSGLIQRASAASATPDPAGARRGDHQTFPEAYVHIGADSSVTVVVKHIEFGQGPYTGLATLVAEELDADWSQVRAVSAPANAALYGNDKLGGAQLTGGSTSMASSFDLMRRAGATARWLLVEAAAVQWNVPAGRIKITRGIISDPITGRNGNFGRFVALAAKLTVPERVELKDPDHFVFIGRKDSTKRLDSASKSDGKAIFGIDLSEAEMLTVVVAHPAKFGARPKSVDARDALKIPGVVAIKPISNGHAVYARGTWPAMKGRKALHIEWDEREAETRSSNEMFDEYLSLTQKVGQVAAQRGDVDAAFRSGGLFVERTFAFPYLAHCPMEPLNGFIHWDGETARLRYGCQGPSLDLGPVAKTLGISVEKVSIETMLTGGSFGRRSQATSHFAIELAEVAKTIGPGVSVKLLWTREDDVQGGYYRPLFVHRMRASVKDRRIEAWSDTVAGQSIFSGTPLEAWLKGGLDPLMTEGARDIEYRFPNFRCDLHKTISSITTSSWRSVGHSHSAYAVECFVDILLDQLGKDPIAGRLEILDEKSRLAGVLRAVASLAYWSGPGPVGGHARGVAAVEAFGTYIAQIAEVSIGKGNIPRIHKIWCAVDCGVAVNPDIIRAQMEGGIGFGLGHALHGDVPIEDGAAVISNFNDYRSLMMYEMPEIEVKIVSSREAPTGVGEIGVPPVAPAVANALARLTGVRPARLPILPLAG